jgi:hypothetical protein
LHQRTEEITVAKRQGRSSFRPTLEVLESRIVPYTLTGTQWPNLNISASFMPDGTQMGSNTSELFAKLDAQYSTQVWEYQFAKALQTWAAAAPLNFHLVADSGAPSGTSGPIQGDPYFGDIRLGAYPSTGSFLGFTYYPYTSSTQGGDIALNASQNYNIGSNYDLYSVLLHESGHALGLAESSVYGSVMFTSMLGVYPGLTADDIAGIQAIYGPRPADTLNNSFAAATSLTPDSTGYASVQGSLNTISGVDYYAVTLPAGTNETLTVTEDPSGLSLLTPQLSVYDANQQLLGTASAGMYQYGTPVTVTLTGLTGGQTIYLAASGATADVFHIGAYQLNVQVGADTTGSSTSNGPVSSGPAFIVAPPVVSTNPVSQTVTAGNNITLTAAATDPTASVQWQVSTNGGATYTNIAGATGTCLTCVACCGENGNDYRAVFSNAAGTATTAAATLKVNEPPVVTINPANQKVARRHRVTFTAAATGTPKPSVQWQVSTDGGQTFKNIAGATSTSLSFIAKIFDNKYQYRAVFTNTAGTVTTTAATLLV